MDSQARRQLFERLQAGNPTPTTELIHRTPFELLVAVVLSAHTTDRSVNAATRRLFPIANTPEALAKMTQDEVAQQIEPVNHHYNKARYLIGLSKLVLERHGGEVPQDRASLEALPGVGRKVASVVLNTAFGHHEIGIDTHIFRVCNRTGLAPGNDVRTVEKTLQEVVPDEFKRYAHHWLLLHGRYVCKAMRPECARCVLYELCEYPDKTA
ncbi:endonuclease III [Chitinimonas lacunae]|uniref:Endonuclease III n=1 Tax=Chitinimonas lacunae TaxID=1963018 RepID=A0ABV8MU52_9NEIS